LLSSERGRHCCLIKQPEEPEEPEEHTSGKEKNVWDSIDGLEAILFQDEAPNFRTTVIAAIAQTWMLYPRCHRSQGKQRSVLRAHMGKEENVAN
jgi:hypothetical protein